MCSVLQHIVESFCNIPIFTLICRLSEKNKPIVFVMQSEKCGNILVIDDDDDVLYTARLVLRGLFEKVDTINHPDLIPKYLPASRYDVILLDMNFARGVTSGKEGLEWLGKIRTIDKDARVLVTTAYGDISLAVQAMKMGAVDFILKPWNKERLVTSIANFLNQDNDKSKDTKVRRRNISTPDPGKAKYPEMIGKSPLIAEMQEIIKTVAPTDANILLLGENGTGKELAAWALHANSLRRNESFVHVDLGSIPETLFEAELFGHIKGAFTDAKEERAGRFEAANGGTLFLDEIGNLTLPMQAKLLTAIQKREIVRIGSNHPIHMDARLISATNMSLYEMADTFSFRQDLLYRINTVEITLPPLRERGDDIRLIAEYYLQYYSDFYGKEGLVLGKDTARKLISYHWPGNIRELAHAMERAVILSKCMVLNPDDFVFRSVIPSVPKEEEPAIRVEDYERKAITTALGKHNGNLSRAADDLGIARSTLYRKISHFGLDNISQAN
jgi:DNA-binding NtrC family response regulator